MGNSNSLSDTNKSSLTESIITSMESGDLGTLEVILGSGKEFEQHDQQGLTILHHMVYNVFRLGGDRWKSLCHIIQNKCTNHIIDIDGKSKCNGYIIIDKVGNSCCLIKNEDLRRYQTYQSIHLYGLTPIVLACKLGSIWGIPNRLTLIKETLETMKQMKSSNGNLKNPEVKQDSFDSDLKNQEGESDVKQKLKRNSSCCICLDRDINIVFKECSHACTCSSCAERLYNSDTKQCPICKNTISSYSEIYIC